MIFILNLTYKNSSYKYKQQRQYIIIVTRNEKIVTKKFGTGRSTHLYSEPSYTRTYSSLPWNQNVNKQRAEQRGLFTNPCFHLFMRLQSASFSVKIQTK